jgi:hypothetical protein
MVVDSEEEWAYDGKAGQTLLLPEQPAQEWNDSGQLMAWDPETCSDYRQSSACWSEEIQVS